MSDENQIMQNPHLKVCISSVGAEIQSVIKGGREYIWNGDPCYWERRAPILFPVVGRIKNKTYTHDRKEYFMDQHGFARDMPFSCIAHSHGEALYRLSYNRETLRVYPFRFHLDVSYRLVNSSIQITWEVSHEDRFPMYFSLGYHPAFRKPTEPENCSGGCYIDFRTDNPLRYQKINSANLVESTYFDLKTDHGVLKITPELFDEDVLIIHAGSITCVRLLTPDKAPYLAVESEAPLWGIWSPVKKNAPFLCIEPWYGCNDPADIKGDLKDRPWIQTLNPGQRFSAICKISFF
ncbi:aldose 1-epimerase family protein [Lachnospiraceae bacterium ASD3451]|uniref:aldose 1-epimerase family protein n=1 Tax=Diplocloster agilis TaxID=2850323 RepID=UPI001D54F539|nr:aldose 1-epimerase family protein [Diplocloster agilis]MBU9746428.1 aldose 1-epimerase family protein [Diplocloster agilis]